MSNLIKGKVLWASERDENGIIETADGKEYYFDISVVGAARYRWADTFCRAGKNNKPFVTFLQNPYMLREGNFACMVKVDNDRQWAECPEYFERKVS